MTVTEILKRKGHLFEVRLSDGTYILVDKDIAVKYSVDLGNEYTDTELKNIEDESDFYRCRSRAVYYLSDSDYTAKGIMKKLLDAGFGKDTVFKTVERMKELSLIDDDRFAENFVKRCNEQNISKRETVEKLVLKGVCRETASYFAEDFCSDDTEKIEILFQKRYDGKINTEKDAEKAIAYFLRKGFQYSDIKSAVSRFTQTFKEQEDN